MSSIDEQVDELLLKLNDESSEIRLSALLSLANLQPNRKIVLIIETIAKSDSSDHIRYVARKYLHQIHLLIHKPKPKPNDSINELKEWTSLDRDKKIEVLNSLSEKNQEDKLNELLVLLRKEKDGWVIASLLKTIGVIGSASQINLIQPYLNHSDPRIQANAIEALEYIGDDIIIPLLLPMLEHKDNRISSNAAKAIYHFDKEKAVSLIKEKTLSQETWYRDSALYCIEKINDRELDNLVLAMFVSELNEELRNKEQTYLEKHNIPIPSPSKNQGNLFDDGTIAPDAIDGSIALSVTKEGKDNAFSLSEGLSTREQAKRLFQKLYSYSPVVAVVMVSVSLLIVGYSLIFAPSSDIASITKTISQKFSPFSESGCSFKGAMVNFSGLVLNIDKANSSITIEYDKRRILAYYETSLPEKIKIGGKVKGQCKITAKTRFGAIYATVVEIKPI